MPQAPGTSSQGEPTELNLDREADDLGIPREPWRRLLSEPAIYAACDISPSSFAWKRTQIWPGHARARGSLIEDWGRMAKFWHACEEPPVPSPAFLAAMSSPAGAMAWACFEREDALTVCMGMTGSQGWLGQWRASRGMAEAMLGDAGQADAMAMEAAKQSWSRPLRAVEASSDSPRGKLAVGTLLRGQPGSAQGAWEPLEGWPPELSVALMFDGAGAAWRARIRQSPGGCSWQGGPDFGHAQVADPRKTLSGHLIQAGAAHLRLLAPTGEKLARCPSRARAAAGACVEAAMGMGLAGAEPAVPSHSGRRPPASLEELRSAFERFELAGAAMDVRGPGLGSRRM